MTIYRLDQRVPIVDPSAWVAPSASVLGAVELEAEVGVWFGAVLRSDTELIRVGRRSNVQDGSVVHADPGFPTTIGEGVTVGHLVMLHGCSIGDGSLIGIGSVVLNGARIGKHCLVGARSLITEGKQFPDGSLIIGAPAVAVRSLTPEQIDGLTRAADHYVENARRFRTGLQAID
ncbi:MAG: gamma carbonic anhydrase family protein [Pseudomonadota bacterium]|nr:gamma carbonic anhydrase family protein [Pseudomonadota bacterium]